MKSLLFVFVTLSLFYFGISWAVNKPKDAGKLIKTVDQTGDELASKAGKVVKELKK